MARVADAGVQETCRQTVPSVVGIFVTRLVHRGGIPTMRATVLYVLRAWHVIDAAILS